MTIYFYETKEKYGEFSNFSDHGISLDNKWWKTTEHYFQAQKFTNAEYQETIRMAADPKTAATLGRSRAVALRADWEQVKDEVMRRAVLAKFQSHRELRALLLATGDEVLVEHAPGDYYWGCGADKSGKNRLGEILQEVRQILRSHALPGTEA